MSYAFNVDQNDDLRARFTVWLNIALRNARNMYFRNQKEKVVTISFEELPLELQVDPYNPYVRIERSSNSFDFEEERLAKAFYELPLMRREVLRMLFVLEMTPEEISQKLRCSIDYVYKQKHRALKKLRSLLEEG